MQKHKHINNALTLPALSPEKTSHDFLMVILFPRSSSKNFSLALSYAQRASMLKEGSFEGKSYYLAGIKNDKDEISIAKSILDCTCNWKGTGLFISGIKNESPYKVRDVLRCLLEALQCNDPKAHCLVVGDHPLVGAMRSMRAMEAMGSLSLTTTDKPRDDLDLPPKILYPCRYIHCYWDVIQYGHPSQMIDQVQAEAVRRGCHWCPLFDASALRILK